MGSVPEENVMQTLHENVCHICWRREMAAIAKIFDLLLAALREK